MKTVHVSPHRRVVKEQLQRQRHKVGRADYEELLRLLGPLPPEIKDVRLVGSVETKGWSDKDLDVLVVLDSSKAVGNGENVWNSYRRWMAESGIFDLIRGYDEGVYYIDDRGDSANIETWSWNGKGFTVDVFPAWSDEL